jgi:hypothetical protein
VCIDDDGGATRAKLLALEKKYAAVAKARHPHPDVGCWWALYDYGLERIKTWAPDYVHPYPGGWGGVVVAVREGGQKGASLAFAALCQLSWWCMPRQVLSCI